MAKTLPKKGDILEEADLAESVLNLITHAQERGMIPIAGIVSRKLRDGQHEILGCGWNHLREGIPGIHGETGAVMNTGRILSGYGDVVVTSSLNPCEFCQRTLVKHLGVRSIRILDSENLKCDWGVYGEAGISPVVVQNRKIFARFNAWVKNVANENTWARDIGNLPAGVRVTSKPFNIERATPARERAIALATDLAERAQLSSGEGEAPIGAVILNRFGEVMGAGHAQIARNNDPSMVAAMAAWRACGAHEHWRDKTLVLTGGLDQIAFSMIQVFRFGQLLLVGDVVFGGELLGRLNVPVRKIQSKSFKNLGDRLRAWAEKDRSRAEEYLGADFKMR
jgi:tRNA(Arg) A34 adenosine deaminase TadA